MPEKMRWIRDQRLNREQHRALAPGQLGKRGVEHIDEAVKSLIDYEMPRPPAPLDDIVVPYPNRDEENRDRTSSRRARLASLVTHDPLSLAKMAKDAFGSFLDVKFDEDGPSVNYKIQKLDREVLGTLEPSYSSQAFYVDEKKVAETVLKTGVSVADRLADMADDFLYFMGSKEAWEKMLDKFNNKREA